MDKKTGGARAYMGILLSGVLAGMMISVGGTVYLSVDSKVVGASLFSIGLFFVEMCIRDRYRAGVPRTRRASDRGQ